MSDTVTDFYSRYDEDGRLDRHPAEFATTVRVLGKLMSAPGRLLDAATGTGRYAFHFASLGHHVWAEDITSKNINILRRKLRAEKSIKMAVRVNDARDLSAYSDGFFDTVLYMGPVYHMAEGEVTSAIGEALRVLRSGGLIAISFVNKFPGYAEEKYAEWIRSYTVREVTNLLPSRLFTVSKVVACDGPLFRGLDRLLSVEAPESEAANKWLASREELIEGEAALESCYHGLVVGSKRMVGT